MTESFPLSPALSPSHFASLLSVSLLLSLSLSLSLSGFSLSLSRSVALETLSALSRSRLIPSSAHSPTTSTFTAGLRALTNALFSLNEPLARAKSRLANSPATYSSCHLYSSENDPRLLCSCSCDSLNPAYSSFFLFCFYRAHLLLVSPMKDLKPSVL